MFLSNKDEGIKLSSNKEGFSILDIRKTMLERENKNQAQKQKLDNHDKEGEEPQENEIKGTKSGFGRPFALVYFKESKKKYFFILAKYPTVFCYMQFVKLVQLRKTHRVWSRIIALQSAVCEKNEIFTLKKFVFQVTKM